MRSQRVLFISLVGSWCLGWFTVIAGLFGLISSFLLNQFKLQEKIDSLPDWQLLLGLGLSIFILMTICLFWAESFATKNIQKIIDKLRLLPATILFSILFVLIILACYFGLAWYLNFLYSSFWRV